MSVAKFAPPAPGRKLEISQKSFGVGVIPTFPAPIPSSRTEIPGGFTANSPAFQVNAGNCPSPVSARDDSKSRSIRAKGGAMLRNDKGPGQPSRTSARHR